MSRIAVKRDFRMYIRRYTSPNENFEYGYLHFNALLHFLCKLECSKPRIAARHPRKCDVINEVKLFSTVPVYCRIYCRKLLTLSNQMWCYKFKCIRIFIMDVVFSFNHYMSTMSRDFLSNMAPYSFRFIVFCLCFCTQRIMGNLI